jgi:hypothetical protein
MPVIGSPGSSPTTARASRRLGQLLAGTLVNFEHAMFIGEPGVRLKRTLANWTFIRCSD